MMVFKKVKKLLGLDRCRIFGSAAAPIMKETLDFFASLDIPLDEVYGMSESTGEFFYTSTFRHTTYLPQETLNTYGDQTCKISINGCIAFE